MLERKMAQGDTIIFIVSFLINFQIVVEVIRGPNMFFDLNF